MTTESAIRIVKVQEGPVMSNFTGTARMAGTVLTDVMISVDLDAETVVLKTPSMEVGRWSLSEVKAHAAQDGIHLHLEDEEVVITTSDDARLALALGLSAAPPALRRHMAAALRGKVEHRFHPTEELQPQPPTPHELTLSREQVNLAAWILLAAGVGTSLAGFSIRSGPLVSLIVMVGAGLAMMLAAMLTLTGLRPSGLLAGSAGLVAVGAGVVTTAVAVVSSDTPLPAGPVVVSIVCGLVAMVVAARILSRSFAMFARKEKRPARQLGEV